MQDGTKWRMKFLILNLYECSFTICNIIDDIKLSVNYEIELFGISFEIVLFVL